MKSYLPIFVLLFSFSIPLFSQQLPECNQVLNQMILANDYFMKKWPDVGKTIITNRERPSNIWTRWFYYEGSMQFSGTFSGDYLMKVGISVRSVRGDLSSNVYEITAIN